MHREGHVKRATASIGDGLSGQGFPKWVYSQRLSTFGKGVAERINKEPTNGLYRTAGPRSGRQCHRRRATHDEG